MYALSPTYLFTPKGFVKDHTIIFDKDIIAVGPTNLILTAYANATIIDVPKHSVLMPGLINAHVHLEFSANKTTLKYGRFLPWLYSVIEQREPLIENCNQACVKKAMDTMLQTGTTTFGAISSYATEMQACIDTPQKVIFFNELIGSNAAMADALFGDFKDRLEISKQHKSDTFIPAIAVHSPYAVHPILVQKAVNIARQEKLPLTAHFLESAAEKEWLENNTGEFSPFFNDLLQQKQAVTTPEHFLAQFNAIPTLFTHATKLDQASMRTLKQHKHTVIHCPISNRLLGNGTLDMEALFEHQIDYVCGTDGLSSNYSLNLFEELKASLFMHSEVDLSTYALSLLHSVTTTAGEALGLQTGRLEQDFAADMLLLDVGEDFEHEEDIALHIILQNYRLDKIYINGKNYAMA